MKLCIAQEHLKTACRAVRAWGLSALFPDLESCYRQRSVARLVDRQKWAVAAQMVGSDVGLQLHVLQQVWGGAQMVGSDVGLQLHVLQQVCGGGLRWSGVMWACSCMCCSRWGGGGGGGAVAACAAPCVCVCVVGGGDGGAYMYVFCAQPFPHIK